MIKRKLNLKDIVDSIFLLGPRMTGKTTLLKSSLTPQLYFDLLDPILELELHSNPKIFWEQVSALPSKSTIVVDEIQKIPLLLNYVQMGIDQFDHQFILSGSSARKLKKEGVNLLGGRALDIKLYPLSLDELSDIFNINFALQFGTLPKIYSLLIEKEKDRAIKFLQSYITTYIKEEIKEEAATRKIGAFNRFLEVAAQSNGQIIQFSNIARECSVPASSVKEYYQILEDTLIGFYLWPFDKNERTKSRPKFYFFDCGVVRAINQRLYTPPSPSELGILFETWFVNELQRICHYNNKEHQFSLWRQRSNEIDILISSGGKPILAIECKSGKTDIKSNTVIAFKKQFPETSLIVASLKDDHKRVTCNNMVKILPYKEALEVYKLLL